MEKTAKKKQDKKNDLPKDKAFVLLNGPINTNPEKPFWKIVYHNQGINNPAKYTYTVYSLDKALNLYRKIAADQNCQCIHHEVQAS